MPLNSFLKHSNRSQQLLESQPHPASAGPSAPSSVASRGDEESLRDRASRPLSYVKPRNDIHAFGPPSRANTFQNPEAQQQQPPQHMIYRPGPDESPSSSSSPSQQVPSPPPLAQSQRFPQGYTPRQTHAPITGITLNTAVRPDAHIGPGTPQDYYAVTTPYSPLQQTAQQSFPSSSEQQQQQQQQQQQAPPPQPPKKSRARFFAFAKAARETPQSSSSSSNNNNSSPSGLSRRISKRQSDGYPVLRASYHQGVADHQQPVGVAYSHPQDWPTAPSSDSLPTASSHVVDDNLAQDPNHAHAQLQRESHPQELYQNPHQRGASRQHDRELTLRVVEQDLVDQSFVPPPRLHSISSQVSQTSDISYQQSPYQQSPQETNPYPQAHPPHHQGTQSQNLSPLAVSNVEGISPVSHESPTEPRDEQRPGTAQSSSKLSVNNEPLRQSSGPSPLGQQPPMAPPGSQQAPSRRPIEQKSESRDGPPPNYRSAFANQGQSGQSPMNHMQQGGSNQQGTYRGGPPQREQFSGNDQGRNTPPPASDNKDSADALKELLVKYKKVKALYFEKTAQVEQLQNTLANQRMSQSRTSLDDSEYINRFNRLDGAVNNLAFNIRKDWKEIPQWLTPCVTADAVKKGAKEMTAVGRAFISRWLTDEIFNSIFHPALGRDLAKNLKIIENNIRLNSPPPTNHEELEGLTTKIVHWRLTTLEGLANVLHSSQADENKSTFMQWAASSLTAHLLTHLNDGVGEDAVKGFVAGIIELAVGIAANIPLESRDLAITYTLPGESITSAMKVEPSLPPLDHGGESSGDSETQQDLKDSAGIEDLQKDKSRKDKNGKSGMRSSIGPGMTSRQTSMTSDEGKREDANRVRLAGFVGVEVRGRQVLVKPTVWAIA